jgi:membrane-associated phospholipid phosphatase
MSHDARGVRPGGGRPHLYNYPEDLLWVAALNRSTPLIVLVIAIGIPLAATARLGPALWDVDPVRAFQGAGALRLPMEVITTLGAEKFVLALVLLLFWCIDKPLGIDLALLLTISGAANITLKALLQGPRPFWRDLSLRLASGPSFSTPSGHAANSTVLFGYLAWRLARRRPQSGGPQRSGRPQGSPQRWFVLVLLLVCIPLVCLSRVYLGVHFPGDVMWGCTEGIVVLVAFIGLRPAAAALLRERSLGAQIALAAGAAAVVLALNLLFLAVPPGSDRCLEGICAAARTQALGEAAGAAGLLMGVWTGLALERRRVRFTTGGVAGQRALRYLVGLLGVMAIELGLGRLPPGGSPAAGLVLQGAGYAAAALWAVFAWPWLFVRLGLAKAEQETRPERSFDE